MNIVLCTAFKSSLRFLQLIVVVHPELSLELVNCSLLHLECLVQNII
jgi:hypothetical protein